jgi:hypothetical protein
MPLQVAVHLRDAEGFLDPRLHGEGRGGRTARRPVSQGPGSSHELGGRHGPPRAIPAEATVDRRVGGRQRSVARSRVPGVDRRGRTR